MPRTPVLTEEILKILDAHSFALESLVEKSSPHIGQNVAYMVDQAKASIEKLRATAEPTDDQRIAEQAKAWAPCRGEHENQTAAREYAFKAGARWALNHLLTSRGGG